MQDEFYTTILDAEQNIKRLMKEKENYEEERLQCSKACNVNGVQVYTKLIATCDKEIDDCYAAMFSARAKMNYNNAAD